MKSAYNRFEFLIDSLPVIALRERVGETSNLIPVFRLEVSDEKIPRVVSNCVEKLENKVREKENLLKVKIDDKLKERIVEVVKEFVEKRFDALLNVIERGWFHFEMHCSFDANFLCVEIYENARPDEPNRQQVLGANIFVKRVEKIMRSYSVCDTLGREFKFSDCSNDPTTDIQIKYRTHNFLVLKNNEIEHVVHFVSVQKTEAKDVTYYLGDES